MEPWQPVVAESPATHHHHIKPTLHAAGIHCAPLHGPQDPAAGELRISICINIAAEKSFQGLSELRPLRLETCVGVLAVPLIWTDRFDRDMTL